MSDKLTTIDLKKVADRIGNQWKQLGAELGIPYHILQNMSSTAQGGSEQFAARMMNRWHQKNASLTPEQVREALMTALQHAGRADLADKIRNSRMTDDAGIQRVFQEISPRLTNDWRDVGTYLGLDFDELNAIRAPQVLGCDFRREMLDFFYKNTTENRREILITALQKLNRRDIIKDIGGPTGTAPPNQAPASVFFQQQLPSAQPEGTNRGTQPMNPPMHQSPLAQGPVSQSTSAIPQSQASTGAQAMSNTAAADSLQNVQRPETSLQDQQAAANRPSVQPPSDLSSLVAQSLRSSGPLYGGMIAKDFVDGAINDQDFVDSGIIDQDSVDSGMIDQDSVDGGIISQDSVDR